MSDSLAHTVPPRLEIVEAGDVHAAAIADFIRVVWTPAATASSVRAARASAAAQNVAEPGLPPPTWIAIREGRIVGYVTTIPIRIWDGQRDWPAYWIKGLMVLPEYRNGPIGYAIMKAAAARLPRSGALAVALPARRLFGALGYIDLGAIPNWIRPVSPARMLRRLDLTALGLAGVPRWAPGALKAARATGLAALAGWAGGGLLRTAAAALRLPGRGFRSGPCEATPSREELSALWAEARESFPAGVVRDSHYLIPRYDSGPDGAYVWISSRDRGKLAGIAILRCPRVDGDARLRGIRVATLVDLLYPPHNSAIGLALLGGVERTARGLGADAILATSSASVLGGILRRQCYLPIPGNVHLLFRDAGGEATSFPSSLADWWMTRGDGLSDEVF